MKVAYNRQKKLETVLEEVQAYYKKLMLEKSKEEKEERELKD